MGFLPHSKWIFCPFKIHLLNDHFQDAAICFICFSRRYVPRLLKEIITGNNLANKFKLHLLFIICSFYVVFLLFCPLHVYL